MANVNRKKAASAKEPKDLWPLSIDCIDPMNIDERLEWYKNIGKHRKNEQTQ